jgi:hypothetical protein
MILRFTGVAIFVDRRIDRFVTGQASVILRRPDPAAGLVWL